MRKYQYSLPLEPGRWDRPGVPHAHENLQNTLPHRVSYIEYILKLRDIRDQVNLILGCFRNSIPHTVKSDFWFCWATYDNDKVGSLIYQLVCLDSSKLINIIYIVWKREGIKKDKHGALFRVNLNYENLKMLLLSMLDLVIWLGWTPTETIHLNREFQKLKDEYFTTSSDISRTIAYTFRLGVPGHPLSAMRYPSRMF